MTFNKLLAAAFDYKAEVTGEVWAMQRGWNDQPHRAASVVAHIGESKAQIVLHSRYELATANDSFHSFVRMFRQHHPDVHTVATCTDDAGTQDTLRRSGIGARRPAPAHMPAELVVHESLDPSEVVPWLDVVSAAGLLALEGESGVAWV